jgi:hypothetical protein
LCRFVFQTVTSRASKKPPSSNLGEFHPQAFKETDVTVSRHPALIVSPMMAQTANRIRIGYGRRCSLMQARGRTHPNHCCGIDPGFIFPFRSGSFVAVPVVPTLIKTAAAPQMRTPLTEPAVRAFVLLIPDLFQRTEESIGRYFKAHSTFIDKLLFIISHSL